MTPLEEAKSYEDWARSYLDTHIKSIVMSDPPVIVDAMAVLIRILLEEEK